MTHPPWTTRLTQSRFLAGLQCPLRLWYQVHNPELAGEIPPSRQALIDLGRQVGKMAARLYPPGSSIGEGSPRSQEAAQSTMALMPGPNGHTVFEGAFVHDGLMVRVDILEKLGDGKWNLIEVKSSSSLKEEYLPDVAVQYYVLKGLGVNLNAAGILNLNDQYVYDGRRLDLKELFKFSDLTKDVIGWQREIEPHLRKCKEILGAVTPPKVSPSRHCEKPYRCEFWNHCTRSKPEFWITELYGITDKKLQELVSIGIEDIRRIPADYPLTALQARIRASIIAQEDFHTPGLAHELKLVDYPIHFLDFETIAPAIPRYPQTKPFQSLPFQWSDHILYENGKIEHRQHLGLNDQDPREEFTRTLLEAIGDKGSIFTYGGHEKQIINQLAEHLARYQSKLIALADRFRDLEAAIRKNYYHPGFHGSFSLKAVLPALVPPMGYDHLAIREGSLASLEYLRMLEPATLAEERERIRNNLLAYCAHDTLGMVKIRAKLLERVK